VTAHAPQLRERGVVAMSGGVDSSLAAALAVEQGWEAIGITLHLAGDASRCCSLADADDARRVAERLGMRFYVANHSEAFRREVMEAFADDYLAGRTPIPCVLCNKRFKFDLLMERARVLGAERVVSGHFARIDRDPETGLCRLRRARHGEKDQTYFLFQLDQAQLERLWFPLGELHKSEVRARARSLGLVTADKPESQEICFVPDGDYARVVESLRPEAGGEGGRFVDEAGRELGRHAGVHRFTVGQRRGLGIASSRRLYVTGIRADRGEVVLGEAGSLDVAAAALRELRWIAGCGPRDAVRARVRIRARHEGADAWVEQETTARSSRIGAPPDPFQPLGQEWGLLPLHPRMLRKTGYDYFIAALRANMRNAGALRIDHAMGLRRMFWIPVGERPASGAYVRYPHEDLLGILALESHRNRCLVIGEDLGTVPEGFRERMAAAGALSYRVIYFEKEGDRFKRPADYPGLSLACASTHDLPTLVGFWEGRDLMLRKQLGLYPSEEARLEEHRARTRDRRLLLEALAAEDLLPASVDPERPEETAMTRELIHAVHAYLARTPTCLLMVQFDDLLGEADQINLPGTVSERPNWRRKLSCELEELGADATVRALAEALRRLRPDGCPLGSATRPARGQRRELSRASGPSAV